LRSWSIRGHDCRMDWLLGGATREEIILVVLMLATVLLAPKVPRLGESLGSLFESAPDDDAER